MKLAYGCAIVAAVLLGHFAASLSVPVVPSCHDPTVLVRIGHPGDYAGYILIIRDPFFERSETSVWLETNGAADLQMGGASSFFGTAALCQDHKNPDVFVLY